MGRPIITTQIMFHSILVLSCLYLTMGQVTKDESEGYYAFEEAGSQFLRPPRVRKPPYMKASFPCPSGGGPSGRRPTPKFTLCGDLNKGYIPLNPLGQDFDGEPYPFELIRNKTLTFLSKALPYLTKDGSIPKVAKFGSEPSYSYGPSGTYDFHRKMAFQHRVRRNSDSNQTLMTTTAKEMTSKTEKTTEESEKTTLTEETTPTEQTDGPKARNVDVLANETSARQSCDQGGTAGMLCSLSSMMSNNKLPIALMSALAQGLSAMGSSSSPSLTTTSRPPMVEDFSDSGGSSSMAETVLSLLGTLANLGLSGTTKNDATQNSNDEPSSLAHVLSVLTGASPGNPSALSLVLKLMASDASPLKALVGGFPAKRRRPAVDDATAETTLRRPQESDYELPPTPCPSSEEYVTPAFARNYQGVWKYVVQIPQEGYFTQTVQQTKCVRNRCEFMDGVCHESPRWVSLLVAETYYPDAFFPTVAPTPASQAPPPVEDFYNFQQYLKRRGGEPDDDPMPSYRSRSAYKEKKVLKAQQHCDGVDHIGCYVVRLYYDWFLVNGSCKCWKPSAKRILTGR